MLCLAGRVNCVSGDKDQMLNNKKKGKQKCAEVDLVTQLKNVLDFHERMLARVELFLF